MVRTESAADPAGAPVRATAIAPPRSRWRWAWLLLLASGLLVFGLVLRFAGLRAVGSQLAAMDLRWASLATGAIVLGTLIGALNSYLLAARSTGVGFAQFLGYFWSGWAIGLVVPGQFADMLSVSLLMRRGMVPMTTSVAALGTDKLISLLVVLSAAAFAPGAIVQGQFSQGLLLCAIGLFGACVVLVLVINSRWAIERGGRIGRLLAAARQIASNALALLFQRPRAVLLNAMLSCAKLAITGVSYWATFRALGMLTPPSIATTTSLAAASGLVAYVPVSLNGLGTVEAVAVGLFGSVGVGVATVAASYVFLRSANLAVAWLPALVILARTKRERAIVDPPETP